MADSIALYATCKICPPLFRPQSESDMISISKTIICVLFDISSYTSISSAYTSVEASYSEKYLCLAPMSDVDCISFRYSQVTGIQKKS